MALVLALVLAQGLPAPGPAAAQSTAAQTAEFDITVSGLRAAVLSFAATVERQDYAATGRLRTTGLVGLVSPITYQARVQGRIARGGLQPRRYAEEADIDSRRSAGVMEYRGRVPQAKRYEPPRDTDAHALDPATQSGTIDPMSAIFAVLRDQDDAGLCALRLAVFDGARRSEITVTDPQPLPGNGRVRCTGAYRRVAGFAPKDMADKNRFPFSVTYARQPAGHWQAVQIEGATSFGTARITRR